MHPLHQRRPGHPEHPPFNGRLSAQSPGGTSRSKRQERQKNAEAKTAAEATDRIEVKTTIEAKAATEVKNTTEATAATEVKNATEATAAKQPKGGTTHA